jgi:hypothetical protein
VNDAYWNGWVIVQLGAGWLLGKTVEAEDRRHDGGIDALAEDIIGAKGVAQVDAMLGAPSDKIRRGMLSVIAEIVRARGHYGRPKRQTLLSPVFALHVDLEKQPSGGFKPILRGRPVLYLESLRALPMPDEVVAVRVSALDAQEQDRLRIARTEAEEMCEQMRRAKSRIVLPTDVAH